MITKEEYQEQLQKIKEDNERRIQAYQKQVAFDNNQYEIGDIVKDHIGSLKIQKIQAYLSYDMPQCVYTGIELKANGEPMKKQSNRQVYSSNIETN